MAKDNPRVAILGIHLESNRFAPVTTGADFRAACYFEGEAIMAEALKAAPAMPAEIPGFVQAMNKAGPWQPVPILLTSCEPGGPIEAGFFRECLAKIRAGLTTELPFDAVYISNHGAMTATDGPDPDGELYALVREIAGPKTPVIATIDLHANISERMVDSADAIISYRTNPHVDQRERAADAADFIRRRLAGETWAKAFIRLPIVAPSVTLLSARGGYCDAINAGQAMLGPDLPLVSAVGGFVYGDIPKNGMSIIAYGKAEQAAAAARTLAGQLWAERERFLVHLLPLRSAIERAVAAGRVAGPPVLCLADCADNPGGGGRGNATDLLEGLIQAKAERVLMGNFVDAAVASQCHAAGIGAKIEVTFNADNADDFGRRVPAKIEVLGLSAGRVVGRRGVAAGRAQNLGPAAAVRLGDITMTVISRRVQCADPMHFETFGLAIPDYRTLVVKSRGHFRAGFDEFFRDEQITEVDARGLTSQVLANFDFRHLPRPVYPLDLDTAWTPPTSVLRP
ncbi:MAG: M81 family peptidase [Alphaproteobacteria bacterium]|nr:M81 family peptidase [Alphaproteobacteria bacterium]